jgi:hypothetical protein
MVEKYTAKASLSINKNGATSVDVTPKRVEHSFVMGYSKRIVLVAHVS